MKKHKALFACFLLFLPACLLAGCAGRATPQPAQAEDLMEQYRVWLDEGAAFDPLIDGYTAGIYYVDSVSYTHLDVYKRQYSRRRRWTGP